MPNTGLTPSWPKHGWDVDRYKEKIHRSWNHSTIRIPYVRKEFLLFVFTQVSCYLQPEAT